MRTRLPLLWATSEARIGANSVGYARMDTCLQHAAIAAGAYADPDAEIVVHLCVAWEFQPVPGKRNVLMTMYESELLPEPFVAGLRKADAIIVPSAWCAAVFRAYVPDVPMYVVPLGIDPTIFHAMPRRNPEATRRRFRWLFVGAHNHRKGWQFVLMAWEKAGLLERDDVELVMKVSDDRVAFERTGNIIVDTRRIDDRTLAALYASADAFVFGSLGEGFGLSVIEAMATGLPTVTPLHTGMREFADESCVIPVPHTIDDTCGVMELRNAAGELITYPLRSYVVDTDALAAALLWTHRHWQRAQRIGRRAARRAADFPWARSGQRLVATLAALRSGDVRTEEAVNGDAHP